MKDESKITNQQFKFICELLWGGVPVDRGLTEESAMFKSRAPGILEHYPQLDKSFFEESKKLESFRKELFELLSCDLETFLLNGSKLRMFAEEKGINVGELLKKHSINEKYLNNYLQFGNYEIIESKNIQNEQGRQGEIVDS